MTTATRNSSPTLVADLSARLGRDQILSSDDDRRFFDAVDVLPLRNAGT